MTRAGFLKAGVLEDGVIHAVEEGTPQGNLVSPALANIFLHYVLDVWFERRFAKGCRGKAFLVRYSDDFLVCFEWESDARAFEQQLKERLKEFSLEVEPSKTALIRFGDLAPILRKRDGLRRAATFDFLGFTHYMRVRKNGRIRLSRKTQAARIRKKLNELGERLSRLQTKGQRTMQQYVLRHLLGHRGYYGISGNAKSLKEYFHQVKRVLYRWLNRRSQRRSFTWERYGQWIESWYPRPQIVRVL